MNDDDDEFLDDDDFFEDDDVLEEGKDASFGLETETWQVLVVDDEPDIHDVTKLALRDFSYLGRGLTLLRAESAAEAQAVVNDTPDIALIILDVVMEHDHAGLEFASWLRDERGILDTRIILRTGQPGQAPERQVILGFDINDYKAKSELTADRLFTSVVAALRGYSDLLENARMRDEFAARMDEQGRAEQALLEILPFPVLQVDSLGLITGANASLAKLVDAADIDDLIGQFHTDCLPEFLLAAVSEEDAILTDNEGTPYSVLKQIMGDDPEAPLGTVFVLIPAALKAN